ncbi:alpha/beta hydrolase [Nocardia sp. CDC159]|uniref:Alpha/beta hydrolase n=1 Tax=Nocardia pulmonis TaxID=2951408 RepID=A0A9X2ED72_9NOCA|nr:MULTISPECIES: alpha/beta hydrolase [Nocardia]MCM6775921.1 alpha/beta hydrolase [Nocardia pulmonis]MCM6788103.1 alpha/beta hydrolase [Nocardia sp. CDC159]
MPYAISNDGTKVHYVDSGGDGPAMILLHSFAMDVDVWQPQIDDFAPGMRVLAVDSRGHGGTPDNGVPFTYWDTAWDTWAVADHAGIDEPVVVVGLSQGGFTAMRMALQHPRRVRGLVLIGTVAAGPSAQERETYDNITVKHLIDGDVPLAEITPTMAAVTIGGDRERHQLPWVEKWSVADRRAWRLAAHSLIDRDDISVLVRDITCPALIMRGGSDQAVSNAEMIELAGQLGGPTRTETIRGDGAAHICTWTHPELCNPLIREFIEHIR